MAFSSFVFLFLFFPLSVLLYFLPGKNGAALNLRRKLILIGLSLLFYAWGEPGRVALLVLSILVNRLLLGFYGSLRQKGGKKADILLAAAVILNIAVLVWGKYGAETLPAGLSFYTFKLLSAWFDTRKQPEPKTPSLLDFALYIGFFPQLISGPIERFSAFMLQCAKLEARLENLADGLRRFLPGLFVKLLLADSVLGLWQRLVTKDMPQGPGFLEALLASFLYAFYIYLDFSSYSDMAIGLGKMFGFETAENFLQPYTAVSVSDFWRRWHVTLSFWFRDYVYIPLGGNRKGAARQILNILIVWSLTGIWHGSGLNYLLWGLYYALLLLAEKFFVAKRLEKAPVFLRRLLTFLAVTFGWVLFAFPKQDEFFAFIRALFGGNGLTNGLFAYMLTSHLAIILAAILFSTELPARAGDYLKKRVPNPRPVLLAVKYVVTFLLLLLSISFLVDQSFSSFLYFQF